MWKQEEAKQGSLSILPGFGFLSQIGDITWNYHEGKPREQWPNILSSYCSKSLLADLEFKLWSPAQWQSEQPQDLLFKIFQIICSFYGLKIFLSLLQLLHPHLQQSPGILLVKQLNTKRAGFIWPILQCKATWFFNSLSNKAVVISGWIKGTRPNGDKVSGMKQD